VEKKTCLNKSLKTNRSAVTTQTDREKKFGIDTVYKHCPFLSSERHLLQCGSSSRSHRYHCRLITIIIIIIIIIILRSHYLNLMISASIPSRDLPSAAAALVLPSKFLSLQPSSRFVCWSSYQVSTAFAGSRVARLAGALEIGNRSDVRWHNLRLNPTGCIQHRRFSLRPVVHVSATSLVATWWCVI
jgi:hypothetical protein